MTLPQRSVVDRLDAALGKARDAGWRVDLVTGVVTPTVAERAFAADPELSQWVADGFALHELATSLPAGHVLTLRSLIGGWSVDIGTDRGPEIDEPVEAVTIAEAATVAGVLMRRGEP
jgi:hypothetical protein